MKYISAEEAWGSFKDEYFGEDSSLAEGFAEDNPLAGSASYEIFLYNIADQGPVVQYLEVFRESERSITPTARRQVYPVSIRFWPCCLEP